MIQLLIKREIHYIYPKINTINLITGRKQSMKATLYVLFKSQETEGGDRNNHGFGMSGLS